jgi:DNA-binding beta-propeller fold protein YncE
VTADDGRAWRIDGESNAVAGNLRVGGQPRDITTDGDHLWVTDRERDRVIEIDAATSRVVDRERVRGGPLEVAVDDRAVWVSLFDSGEAARIPR